MGRVVWDMFQWKNLCDKEMVSNINVMRILNNAQA